MLLGLAGYGMLRGVETILAGGANLNAAKAPLGRGHWSDRNL